MSVGRYTGLVDGANGVEYVRREELQAVATHMLEAIGALTRETAEIKSMMGDVHDAVVEVRRDSDAIKQKVRKLPNLVASAVDEAEEITAVRNLKKELATVRKAERDNKNIAVAVIVGAMSIMLAGLVMHYIFHIG